MDTNEIERDDGIIKMSALTSEILFEKFQIIDVLKKDEHAAVFLANHIYLSKKIILKILNTQKIPDQSIIERFKREAKILAQLDHPNIIKVLDFGMSKEFFYISFEYIEGESLRNVLKTKTLSQEQKEHLMIQFLKGLDYAHKNQIIHRDIKPENIFVDKNLNVKLGDFGLALSSEDNFITNPYSIVGTPSYMSPEQVRGAKLTAQSDLFSAGVVLFELFTGKNPFLGDNVSLTLNEIISYDEMALEEKLNDLPEHLKKVLLKLLKKNVNQRYNRAEEILEELNVQTEQPAVIVNSADRKAWKTKIGWIFLAVFTIVVIGIAVVFRINERLPNATLPNVDKGNIQQKNNLSKQNTNAVQLQSQKTKEQEDLNKLNQPSVDDKQQSPIINQQNENPAQSKSPGYGGLFIECIPWAKVYINGEEIETTPLRRPIKLLEGEYTLKLVHPDYPIYTKVVSIKAEEVTPLRVSLDAMMGFLNTKVFPWGDVFVNGELKGQTPLRDLIKVTPGSIRLTIKNPNYKEIDTAFYLRAGDTLKLNFTFKNR
ncbi:MAG: serine/threonine-protein kinase [Bacteroidota bacterium]